MSQRAPRPAIRTRRIYDDPRPDDGYRVLVDRLWPRGIAKAHANLDAWEKEIAPSTELRRWYGHDPDRWPEFQARYRAELATHPERLDALLSAAGSGVLTLLYAAREERHNSATVLKEVLEDRLAHG